MKLVKDAGYTIMSLEDQACLLKCVEDLQKQRNDLSKILRNNLFPDPALEEHF